MGQAKIRKMNGTYPEQTSQIEKKFAEKIDEMNEIGHAAFHLYLINIAEHSTGDMSDQGLEKASEDALHATIMKDGASIMSTKWQQVMILEMVVWMKHNGEWVKRSAQEKQAFAKKINEFWNSPVDVEALESLEYNLCFNVENETFAIIFGFLAPDHA